MKELTERQQEILDYISNSIRHRGYPPTIREIGEYMGIRSTNGVNDHLKALERKGHLRRDDLKSRAMRPVNMEEDFIRVPLVGHVAAGLPILAVEEADDSVCIDRFLLGDQRDVFALRVRGDSMIEDGIHNGDYLFVNKTTSPQPGDVVVALIDNEGTCKRFYPERDQIRFQPANASMKPIYVHRRDFRQAMIIGTVIGVYRKI